MEIFKKELEAPTIRSLGGILQNEEEKKLGQNIIDECTNLLKEYSQSRDAIVEAIGNLWSKLTYYQEGRGISIIELTYWCQEVINSSKGQKLIPASELTQLIKLVSDFLTKEKIDNNLRYAAYNHLLTIDNSESEKLAMLLADHLADFDWDGIGFAIHLLKLKYEDKGVALLVSRYKNSKKWDQITKQIQNYFDESWMPQ